MGGVSAIIDTGTALVYFPIAQVDAFYALIPDSQPVTTMPDGFYSFPCDSPPLKKVAIHFGNTAYDISMADFNIGSLPEDPSMCLGGIVGVDLLGSDEIMMAIVGIVYLKSWYSVYDFETMVSVHHDSCSAMSQNPFFQTVGFAQAIHEE